jgi:KipI family sensor histidine kinase inhibitor
MLPAGLDITPLGPDTLIISWPQQPTPGLARLLGNLAKRGRSLPGVRDAWPGLRELAIQYDPQQWDFAELAHHCLDVGEAAAAAIDTATSVTAQRHRLPVIYNGDDLVHVADRLGLSVEQVIALHHGTIYTIGLIGFLPHFPYLLGLDERLQLPRRPNPRTLVTAGSVAIADTMSAVYPCDSPGGWHILGHTDPSALQHLAAGDEVEFFIDEDGHDHVHKDVHARAD